MWAIAHTARAGPVILETAVMAAHPKTEPVHPDPKQNQILASLPAEDYERLLPDLELVPLPRGLLMLESGEHVDFLHFPISGIVSLIYELEDQSSSETALVGNEGLVGISIYMGGESLPSSTEVQVKGEAFRLSRKIIKREFALGGKLQHLALLYSQVLLCQTSQAALCNQHHTVEQKFCRWLLASLDRLNRDTMAITQAQLSHLLGARRETVTKTARRLEKDGLIATARGSITLLDRSEMESRVCECYQTVKEECERLMPAPKGR